MKVSELKNDELVTLYIQLRDRRAQRKAAYDNDDVSDKQKQEKIENLLLARFQDQGVESVRTAAGTAYKYVRESCTTADADLFWQYVLDRNAFELVEKRPNKTAIKQYKEEHQDIPPGLNWREEITIGVRRS